MQLGDRVKLHPSIFDDLTRKSNFHLFDRIIKEDLEGEVVGRGKEKYHSGWWVKFYYGKVLVEENQVIPL